MINIQDIQEVIHTVHYFNNKYNKIHYQSIIEHNGFTELLIPNKGDEIIIYMN